MTTVQILCRFRRARRTVLFTSAVIALYFSPADAQERSVGMVDGAAWPVPDPLSLQNAVHLANEHRAEIVAAHAAVRSAEQLPSIAGAPEDPMISASLDHVPFALDGVDVSLSVEQRFPLSGLLGKRRRVAELVALQSQAEANRTSLDVELETLRAFFVLQTRRQMLLAVETQRAASEQLFDGVQARYASGVANQTEVRRAHLELSRVLSVARVLVHEVREAEIMLNASMGRTPLAPLPTLAPATFPELPASPDAASAMALTVRPELQGARLEIDRTEAESEMSRAMSSPMALLRTGPSYTMSEGPGWMLMFGLTVPIWRGRVDASVAQAEALQGKARADLEATERTIRAEVMGAYEQVLGSSAQAVTLREQLMPEAKEMIDAALAAYVSGAVPMSNVLEAITTYRSLQQELLDSDLAVALAWAQYLRAVGLGTREAFGPAPRGASHD